MILSEKITRKDGDLAAQGVIHLDLPPCLTPTAPCPVVMAGGN